MNEERSNIEIAMDIQKKVLEINKLLNDFECGVITASRLDLLVRNSLHGIQNRCRELGLIII